MSVLPDWMLVRDKVCLPLENNVKRENKISWGVGSYGIDARIGYKFKVFSPINSTEIDPKNFDSKCVVDVERPNDGTEQYVSIPPHSFALAETIEVFDIPRDTHCIVLGKSTYARCGLIVNCTPLEPEWKGVITLELSNTTPLPLRVYAGEGICQCVFIRSDGWTHQILLELFQMSSFSKFDDFYEHIFRKELTTCKVSYADKKGKYQNQTGLTLPTVDKKSE